MGEPLVDIRILPYCMYMREYILGRRISGETGTVRHSESWVQLLKQLTVVSARNKRIFSKYQLSSLDLRTNLNSGVPDIRTSGHPEFQYSWSSSPIID